MLALKFIRENPELVREGAKKKKINFEIFNHPSKENL